MKKIILPILLLALSTLAFSMKPGKKKKVPKYTLEGTITESRDYCGGTPPPADRLFPKSIPKAGIKLLVRKGNFNNPNEKIIDSLLSDAEGKFKINLPAGTYTFIEPWKRDSYKVPQDNEIMIYDTACYRKRYHEPDYTLEVKKNIRNITINFHRPCSWRTPCVQYNGPKPPASNPGRGKTGE